MCYLIIMTNINTYQLLLYQLCLTNYDLSDLIYWPYINHYSSLLNDAHWKKLLTIININLY
jgi:hypothetical protein